MGEITVDINGTTTLEEIVSVWEGAFAQEKDTQTEAVGGSSPQVL